MLQARFFLTCVCAAELFCSCLAGVPGPPKLWPTPISPINGVDRGVGVVCKAEADPKTDEKILASESVAIAAQRLTSVDFPTFDHS